MQSLIRVTYTEDKRADYTHMSLPAAGHHGKECHNATKCDDGGSLRTATCMNMLQIIDEPRAATGKCPSIPPGAT